MTLFDYERHIAEALESVAASTCRSIEIVIVDDASEDASVDRARDWIAANPQTPAILARATAGTAASRHARNAALDFARAPLAFVLDADNAVYPHGLERLAPSARRRARRPPSPTGSSSASAAPARSACSATAPGSRSGCAARTTSTRWRSSAPTRCAPRRGYATDPRLHGWEDYDLWCRMAESGRRGVGVPEIVGRYRIAQHSMLRSTTALSNAASFSLLAERHPALMAGIVPPD